MIKSHKRYVFIAIVLLFFVVRWWISSTTSTTTTAAATQTYTVANGTIENTLKLIWTTKITNMQTLVFWAEGKVTNIYVKEGDKVKAGQLLAEIDKKSLSISLSQQALSIQNARLNYNKLLTQYTAADIAKAQNDVNSAQTKLSIAKQQLSDMSSDQWKTISTQGNVAQTNIIFSKSIVPKGNDILLHIHDVLNGNQKDYISIRSPSNWVSAQSYYSQSNIYYQQFITTLSALEATSTTTLPAIQDLQNKSSQLLNVLSLALDTLVSAVNDSLVWVDLSQTTLDDIALNPLKADNSTVLSLRSTLTSNISSLQNSNTTIQSKKDEVSTDTAQLQMLQQTLQDMQNGPDSTTRALQSNSIKQSQLSYQQTSQQLNNYQIIAPFDGTIDTIGFKVGDTVSYNAGSSANGITVSNPDAYEVNTLIDQIDIVKVMPWQAVEITFDAYPGYLITWTIASIDPTPVTSAGVVSYQARINLQQISGKKIYDSMSANIKVIVEHKDNILTIPTAAIQTSGDQAFVWTQQWMKNIGVWITDGVNTEILSWLQQGDIVSVKEYQAQAAAKSTSVFWQGQSSGTWRSSWQANSNQSFRMLQGGWGWGTRPGN